MYNNTPNKYSRVPANQDVIRMTAEEERIYKECDRDGFIKKGIPYGSIGALLTYGGLHYGLLKPSPKYGYMPAMITTGCMGVLLGLASHKAACVQKVLDMPNSSLRQKIETSLKKNQYEAVMRTGQMPPDLPIQSQPKTVSDLPDDDYQTPHDFDSYTGVNTDTDQHSDFYTMEPLDRYAGPATTYDELRQKNREEYMRSQMARISSRSDIPRMAPQPTAPHLERNHVPFDHDRPPQYQLND